MAVCRATLVSLRNHRRGRNNRTTSRLAHLEWNATTRYARLTSIGNVIYLHVPGALMDVIFRTNELRRCYEETARAVRRWGPDVGRTYIRRIRTLYAVIDFHDAYQRPALRLHPLRSSQRGEMSIYLTGRWRLIVTKGDTEETVIIEEVSNHYDD